MRAWHRSGSLGFTVVLVGVATYLAGLSFFFPSTINNFDEAHYLRTAYAFSTGSPCLTGIDALTGQTVCEPVQKFLPGTSALMAPFVALFGWQGAFLVPALSLVAAVLATALWLRSEGRSALFALMVLGFPPALVLGRVGTSDVISTALVANGLWLFWTGGAGHRGRWLASGFLAGLSLSFRETNVLLFAPFYLGSLLRRERGVAALVAGGVAGYLLRPLGTFLVYGDPFYVYSGGPGFALANVPGNLAIYAIALLVFVPAGLVGALLYRGPRRPEVLVTVVAFVALFLLWGYRGQTSGFLQGLILGPRYYGPLTPLLAFAAAESFPRLWAGLRDALGRPRWGDALMIWGVRVWAAGVIVVAFAVHPVFSYLTRDAARFRDAVYTQSTPGSLVVLDQRSSLKYVNRLFGNRVQFDYRNLDGQALTSLLERYGSFFLVLLDRSDSSFWRARAEINAETLTRVEQQAALKALYDSGEGAQGRLRIWRVTRPPGDHQSAQGHVGDVRCCGELHHPLVRPGLFDVPVAVMRSGV